MAFAGVYKNETRANRRGAFAVKDASMTLHILIQESQIAVHSLCAFGSIFATSNLFVDAEILPKWLCLWMGIGIWCLVSAAGLPSSLFSDPARLSVVLPCRHEVWQWEASTTRQALPSACAQPCRAACSSSMNGDLFGRCLVV